MLTHLAQVNSHSQQPQLQVNQLRPQQQPPPQHGSQITTFPANVQTTHPPQASPQHTKFLSKQLSIISIPRSSAAAAVVAGTASNAVVSNMAAVQMHQTTSAAVTPAAATAATTSYSHFNNNTTLLPVGTTTVANMMKGVPTTIAQQQRSAAAAAAAATPPPPASLKIPSGKGRKATNNKLPPGAVNLERSYQICQAVIQNSPNRENLKAQLRPPSAILSQQQQHNQQQQQLTIASPSGSPSAVPAGTIINTTTATSNIIKSVDLTEQQQQQTIAGTLPLNVMGAGRPGVYKVVCCYKFTDFYKFF